MPSHSTVLSYFNRYSLAYRNALYVRITSWCHHLPLLCSRKDWFSPPASIRRGRIVFVHLCVFFYAPGSNDRGHIFLSCLFVCLCVVNIILRYNFWTVRDRDFIFGMHTPLPLSNDPKINDLVTLIYLEAKNSFLDFVASRCIVFHKHTLIFKLKPPL